MGPRHLCRPAHLDRTSRRHPSDEEEDIFSGSVVFDRDNTSGFGAGTIAPLVAIYTSAFKPGSAYEGIQAQSVVHSRDGGYTWTKHAANPALNRGSEYANQIPTSHRRSPMTLARGISLHASDGNLCQA